MEKNNDGVCGGYNSLLRAVLSRNHSESEFSVDKRWFGWKVEQRREDRINTALSCTSVWHNLFNLYGT